MDRNNKSIWFYIKQFWFLLFPVLVYFCLSLGFQMLAVVTGLGLELYLFHTMGAQALENLIAAPLLFLFFYKRDRLRRNENIKEEFDLSMRDILLILGVSFCFSRGWNLLIGLTPLPDWFPAYEIVTDAVMRENIWIQILAVVIAAPLLEELLMRGILYGRMRELAKDKRFAILGSALVFGLIHGNVVQGLYAFLMGVLFAWLVERYGSIWAPVLAHALANGISLWDGYADLEMRLIETLWGYLLVTALFLLLGCFLARKLFDNKNI